jgi:hypothetical protein
MSAVSEWIVREYFEHCGFLVHAPVKYSVMARTKRAEEDVDLIVVNPRVEERGLPSSMVWNGNDLRQIARAVVSVKGWHTDRFGPTSPGLLRFTDAKAVEAFRRLLGDGPVAKILCLPELPASPSLRRQTLEALAGKGVDGVLLFPTILRELAAAVEASKSYEKSDLLQVLRILKIHGLLREGEQMEFFRRGRRKA